METQEKSRNLAQSMLEAVNGSFSTTEFVGELQRGHRYLQNEVNKLALAWIAQCYNDYKHNNYDPRNAGTVKALAAAAETLLAVGEFRHNKETDTMEF